MDYSIIHVPQKMRFETEIDGLTAYVKYRLINGTLEIMKTSVPQPLEGRGIASSLVKHAFDYARENHLKPTASCPYAAAWLHKHPEYRE